MARYATHLHDRHPARHKAHPLDRLSRALPNAISLNDEGLDKRECPSFAFGSFPRSDHGLLHVANEFLFLDRPIAYFFPDRDAYRNQRGIFLRDALEHLAGSVLESASDITAR